MTQTHSWLETRRKELLRYEVASAVLIAVATAAVALGLGALLGHLGWYRSAPLIVLFVWALCFAGLTAGAFVFRRRSRSLTTARLASRLEVEGGLRDGALRVLAGEMPRTGSSELGDLADRNMSSWLDRHGLEPMVKARAQSGRLVTRNAMFAVGGALLLLMSRPLAGPARPLWSPLDALNRGAPILTLDAESVERGATVLASVDGRGRASVTLWTRAPGQAWQGERLELDSLGLAEVTLGPIESDLFVRATAGTKSSGEQHISVFLPAILSELSLVAQYPRYIERDAEPLSPGDSVALPVGTRVMTAGRATVSLADVAWTDGENRTEMDVDSESFEGVLIVRTSGRWEIDATTHRGTDLSGSPTYLHVVAIPDSAPIVNVPVPGVDTTPPLTLLQPLVIDVRDDYLITSVEVVSRRVSRLGLESEPVVDSIALPEGGADRSVLQWVLDLNERGFLPGDTAYYKVRARDNNPRVQIGESREFKLRLPTLRELRRDVTERTDDVAALTDSLAEAQRELNRLAEELAAESARELNEDGQLDFESSERARQLSERQQELLNRAQEVQDQIEQLADMAAEAGINDPEFFEQLREIRDLLNQAISDELQQRLQDLREAMERLDSRSLAEALQDLSERQERLQEEFERSRDLFERAALEGQMTNRAEEAEQIAREQAEWNQAAEFGDSSLAAIEDQIAAATDSLAAQLAELAERMEGVADGQELEEASQSAEQASAQMSDASQMARQGNMRGAQQSGEAASESMMNLPQEIRDQRDEMRDEWREEVLELLDRALAEVADLAGRQQEMSERLGAGAVGAEMRGEQAALRDGVDRVIERLQEASGMNALVSPRLSMAMGFTKLQMTEVLNQLSQASPNGRTAAEASGEAIDGLNQVAHGLLRGRSDVQGAESGSGVEEALEQLSEMAQAQQGLNGQTTQMLPMMEMGGDQLIQQLRQLAMQQMQLAEGLDRLDAEGEMSGLNELAEEARELARQLDAAQLDRSTVERQERLFRRMLDAGRTLRSDRPDERLERESRRPGEIEARIPDAVDPATLETGPRFRFPGWELLGDLTAQERRLVLEYFRRINRVGQP